MIGRKRLNQERDKDIEREMESIINKQVGGGK